jgi:methylated-DNA-[protein]-cysteine S-methyltransferase
MILETPFGPSWAEVDEAGALTAFGFGPPRRPPSGRTLPTLENQLAQFFAGARPHFDLPLDPIGTNFQKQVWAELLRIPPGQRITYAELARRVGRPGAARAVGRANATNPIALIVPCHRVVGLSGKLTGYEYGLERKEKLLRFESETYSRGPYITESSKRRSSATSALNSATSVSSTATLSASPCATVETGAATGGSASPARVCA